MQRKLLATVAAAPLVAISALAIASAANAEVTVTTRTTTGVATATASASGADNIRVTSAGALELPGAGPAATVNSNNTFTNEGSIFATDVNGSIGILVLGGFNGGAINKAGIVFGQSAVGADADGDGDFDGPLATGSGKYAFRLTGPGVFTGNLTNDFSGRITMSGNDSYGFSVETLLAGSLTQDGAMVVTGDRSYGIRNTGGITGNVTVTGSVSVQGAGSVGVDMDADVGGQLRVQTSVTAYGYRYLDRPFLATDRAKLDADDLLQGGSAMRIAGNVGSGLFIEVPPADLIADDGKADTTTDSDEDGDGITDVLEGSGSINVYGGAPALLVGSDTRAITLGAVGAGDLAYGIVNRGTITAAGLYDGVAATAVQIGGSTGQSTVITNGMFNKGVISATSYEANSTGLVLKPGARIDTLINTGAITGASIAESAVTARGLLIEQGASMSTLTVNGAITADMNGEKGSAIAIEDRAGTLRSVTNTGVITAAVAATDDADDKDDADLDATNEVVTGKAIAMDLRAATGGVTIRQYGVIDGDDNADGIADTDTDADGVDDGDEPLMVGEVLLSAFDDAVDIQNGNVLSNIAFGTGADSLTISGGAKVAGRITDTDGRLSVNVAKGSLAFNNAETVNISSLSVGSTSQLLFSVDPTTGLATKLVVAGAARLDSGAQLGITLRSILDAPTRYTVIEAGSLTAGVLSQDLFGSAPYLYVAQAGADTAAGKVFVDVRPRTPAEMGFSTSQASAYNAVLSALKGDQLVQDAVLSQTTRAGLVSLYNQLTPDTGEGSFAALQTVNQLMAQATAVRPDPYDRYGPDSFWAQEINTIVRREDGATQGSDSQVFGFMGGYESMSINGGALGATLAYVNVEEHDTAAVVGENTTASVLQAGVYYRRQLGGFSFNAGGGGGYSWFDGNRRFIAPDLNADGAADVIRTNSAEWNGVTANAFAGVSYQAMLGRFYTRPEMRLDYLYLKEGERAEKGGGSALDLTVQERTGSNLSGEAAVTFGANFGRDVWFRPEVRLGYRQSLGGELGDTVASFAGGTPFTVLADTAEEGAVTLNIALRSGTPMSYVAVEAGAEARKKQKRYNVRLNGRVMF